MCNSSGKKKCEILKGICRSYVGSDPDGGGFCIMIMPKGVWIYEKGFMQYEKF